MKKIFTIGLLVGATLLFGSAPAFAGNLVRNGGFDEFNLAEGKLGPRATRWNYFDGEYLDKHKLDLGWQVTDGSTLEVRRNRVVGLAHNGSSHFAELDSHNYKRFVSANEEVGIFQDIVTKAGKKYEVSFAYAARPGINGNRNQFEMLFGDVFTQKFDGGNGRTRNGRAWKTFSTKVMADSDITRLQFNYLGRRDTLGAHIDSVSVTAVPEPASLVGLALFGMIGAGAVVKRKQEMEQTA